MLKPARMTRILVGGHKDHLESVIDTLHGEGVLHIEDYRDPTRVTGLGSPLEEGEQVSDLLVRVRGLQKAIDAPSVAPRDLAVDDFARPVEEAEEALQPAIEALTTARTAVAGLESEIAQLEPLRSVDVDLGAVRATTALRTYIGTVREDPAGALQAAGVDHELSITRAASGLVAVLHVRPSDAQAAERALGEAGFAAAQVPPVEGTPAEALKVLEARLATERGGLATAETELVALAERWATRLASLEHHLSRRAEQTSAPLRFGVTDNTFHVEGWLPVGRLNHLRNVLAAGYGESLYLEDCGDAPMQPEGHEGHGGHGDHHEVSVDDEAPTALVNKGPSRSYEFMLGLMSTPRYRELDPTKLIAFFFPLFFGLMIGDVVIGLFILLFALWLRRGNVFGIGGPGVAKPLMWGAIIAILVGLFVFGEGLGLHFVVSDQQLEEGEFSWESAFGLSFPDEGFIHKVDTTHGGEGEAGNPFAPHGGTFLSVNGWFTLGHYSKVHDVEALLLWSGAIGVVHLVLGFILGVRNVAKAHGVKLAVQEKASWLMIMVAAGVMAWGITSGVAAATWGGVALFVVAVALLWMGVQATLGVGFVALLELPGLLGNILSYTRLAAIGASKAGMAIAFATIGFELIGGPAGIVVYLLASLLITVLAILSGGLQSLRLQFVEFFSKFYEGGGRPYLPFGRRAA